mgnify:CR=1 FL=1
MSVTKRNAQSCDQEVLHSNKPVLVDFYADWCGPCKMLSPVVEEIAGESDAYRVCKINVDDAPEIAARYRVSMALVLRLFLPSEMRSGKVGEIFRAFASLAAGADESEISPRATAQRALFEYLQEHGKTPCTFLRERFSGALAALEKKGLVAVARERVQRSP